VERPPTGGRWRRVAGAAFAVIGSSFLILFVPIIAYAFVLAFRARGAPDQAAINQFAATISPTLMPWLEGLLTLLLAFWVVRRSDVARAVDGLVLGVLSGLLSVAVTLAFGGRLAVRSLILFLVVAGLGLIGGVVARRMPPKA
jgi:hypothetical protein